MSKICARAAIFFSQPVHFGDLVQHSRRRLIGLTLAAITLSACGGKEEASSAAQQQQPTVQGKFTAEPPNADTDKTVNGTGAPAGYVVQLDIPGSGQPSYAEDDHGRWEVHTGPAHILYSTADVAQKKYSVTATFEQVEAPAHPEAYGIILGGSDLDQPAKQRYTYFIVRGDGKYMVKVRNGDDTQTITDWTAHPAIPHQDAAGKAVYGIRIDVDGAVAKVRVNGQPVTMISGPKMPLQGIAGLRINHNLHLIVTRLQLTRES
jgi:hypothetical protein